MKNIVQVKVRKYETEILMAKRNLDRSQLAIMVGIGVSYLTRIINGDTTVSPKVRERLMGIFDCKWDDIFFTEKLTNDQKK